MHSWTYSKLCNFLRLVSTPVKDPRPYNKAQSEQPLSKQCVPLSESDRLQEVCVCWPLWLDWVSARDDDRECLKVNEDSVLIYFHLIPPRVSTGELESWTAHQPFAEEPWLLWLWRSTSTPWCDQLTGWEVPERAHRPIRRANFLYTSLEDCQWEQC